MEEKKSMLHDKDLPMHLWAKATKIVLYVQNHNPHRLLDNKNPKEDFSGEKLEVNHLRILHTYPKGEEVQDRSFWEEGYIRRI